MNAFVSQLLAGLATGGIYASLALALVVIYRSTHHVNFAQGEMARFSTFVAAMLIEAGWPDWATLALEGAVGAATYLALFRWGSSDELRGLVAILPERGRVLAHRLLRLGAPSSS